MIMSKKQLPSAWAGSGSTDSNGNDKQELQTFTSACSEKMVDGKLSLHLSMSDNEKEPLHTGKWSEEEMAYAEGLIDEFKAGNLALPDGTSLRQFLAKMLNCSPKRISKRYEGNNYSKGRKFYVKSNEKMDPMEAQSRRRRLNDLERQYKQKLMHLKMPHLLLANRTTEFPEKELLRKDSATGNLQIAGSARDELSLAAAATSSIPASFRLGLASQSIADSSPMGASLQSLRMEASNVLRSNLASNPHVQLSNPRSMVDANHALSRLADDAGTLALMTQVSSQRDGQSISSLLEAQRRLNTSAILGGNIFGRHQDLLGASSLGPSSSLLLDRGGTSSLFNDRRGSSMLGDLSSLSNPSGQQSLSALETSSLLRDFSSLSNPPGPQSLGATLSQQRLQQLLREEQLQLRSPGQQRTMLSLADPLSRLQANVAASLPSNTLATHPLTLLPPPTASLLQQRNRSSPSNHLQSLLHLNSQAGAIDPAIAAGGSRGQKRRASETLDDSNSSHTTSSRRRL